jgi:uncharacterized protein YyaL (SSP411 family)
MTTQSFSQNIVKENKTKEKYVNRLAKESSPYLLQHKNNPVNWYPWGREAFDKAKELDLPIFLSIGYSTCHWCHVMEHESFEDEKVAQLLNENYISIKVDREELPEIDHVYMSVCQAMTGRGGWPLTIIMTPSKEPFFAGTYFSKTGRFGRPGMLELLPSISDAWKNKREELIASAEKVNSFLLQSNKKVIGETLDQTVLENAYAQFISKYDKINGGFGTKPKFPSAHNLIFLLRYHYMNKDKTSLMMVENTLQKMRLGGIFDHIGYGFHRYSTDKEWLVPHFEKMLYDQAMLTIAYTEAFQITGNKLYQNIAEEILAYVSRDMTDKRGGFYSAEDADSEGEEGLFYFWTLKELQKINSEDDLSFLKELYNLDSAGNFKDEATGQFTGNNIFHLNDSINDKSKSVRIKKINQTLFKIREQRIHPFKDDKILTDWNGLMIVAYAKAGIAFKNESFINAAEKSAQFIFKNLTDKNGRLIKRYRNGVSGIDAHLDDYAFIIWGLLELYEATFKASYLSEAIVLNNIMIEEFWRDNGGFYLGSDKSEQLIVRALTGYDGAIPSGNSIAAYNLLKLTRLTGEVKFAEMAEQIFKVFSNEIKKTPTGYTSTLSAFMFEFSKPKEIVVVGSSSSLETQSALNVLKSKYIPNKVILFKDVEDKLQSLSSIAKWTSSHEMIDKKTTYYICEDFSCKLPTTDIEQALKLINE